MKRSVVAAVDFSIVTPVVMEQAVKEAKLRAGATLHLLHVLPPPAVPVGAITPPSGFDLTAEIQAAREELDTLGRSIEDVPIVGHVRVGSAPDEIIALANEVDADLVVVGASHKGIVMRALVGSTTEPLMHRAPCSLLIARPYAIPEVEPPRPSSPASLSERRETPYPAARPS